MNTFIKKLLLREVWSILLLINLSVPIQVKGQTSPFPTNYILPNDTIPYNRPLNYLIITADSLRPAFKDFALSKAFKGYDVTITAVEDIYQNYSLITTDSVERIKWYIAEYYIEKNKNLQFILLGGDTNIIPTRYAAPRTTFDDTEPIRYANNELKLLATDRYYTSFQNSFNWDCGVNGRYAEVTEKINLLFGDVEMIVCDSAELIQAAYISRLPVRNSSDIINYTQKLFRYERDELNSSYSYIRALFAGCKTFYDVGSISDSQYWGDSICNNFLTDRMVTKLYDNNFTASGLHSALSSNYGYNLVNINTHGIETGWLMNDGVSYYNTNLANMLNANAASIITTTACDVADFTVTQSLGESFILNPNNNNIAFWGSSNFGWGPENQYKPGSSVELIGHFYRNLKNEPNKQLGHIVDNALSALNYDPFKYSTNRFLCMSQTLLGDAEFTIYSSAPNHITPINLTFADGTISYSPYHDNVNYYLLFESSANNSEYNYYSPVKIENTNFAHEGPFQMGITQEGYAPWRSDKDYYDTVSMQHTDLDGEHLRAQNYVLGKTVSNYYPSGANQIVVGSNVTFEVGKSLTITDSFTCPLGATLTIKPLESIY